MSNTINVFTLNGCSHCIELKKTLNKENIVFKEFEVNQHPEIYRRVLEVTKIDALPTVYIQDTETGNGPLFVAGKDFFNPNEFIEKAKKMGLI